MALSLEIDRFNEKLLFVSWKEVNFDSSLFSEEQKDLIKNIIKYIPEWKRLVGCKQHNIHDYCLDIHTLSVLKIVQNSEEYSRLERHEKLILLYAALLHDIEKPENKVDHEHPLKGAEKSCSILYRLGFDENFISNVYILIRFHQIMGLLAADRIKLTGDELVKMFKKPLIVDLQAILSAADIKSVKKDGSFYEDHFDEKFILLKKEIKSFLY